MPPWYRLRRLLLVCSLLATTGLSACLVRFWSTKPRAVDLKALDAGTYTMKSPMRVHLLDGTTVVFRNGATVGMGRLIGVGAAYPLLQDTLLQRRDTIALADVVGVETYEGKVLMAQSVTASIAASAVTAFGTALLMVAIFGSCPTLYADSGTGPVLQAEGFSYAIAPMLEHRDVDPLNVRPGPDGIIRLELRNEAMETHFINHVELLAVRHATGASLVPDQSGKVVLVDDAHAFTAARDRAGRDVRPELASADGQLFASAPSTVASAHVGDLDDWIDVDADNLAPGDSVAVVLRLRNSLLNTVLLYDGILGGRDAGDWLTTGMLRIGTALEVSRWYVGTMGMHATVDGVPVPARAGYHARLGDVGPIAYRDVAIVLPRSSPNARRVHVRLRFVADEWRIDKAFIGGHVSRPVAERVQLARVLVPTPADGGAAREDTAAFRALGDADDQYLQTMPGQRMMLHFNPGRSSARADSTTTYLMAWQGWYREWLRGSWLAQPSRTTPWVPGDSAVSTALTTWRAKRLQLEREFYATRVPVQ